MRSLKPRTCEAAAADPDRLGNDLLSLHRWARARARGHELELYHRASVSLRVSRRTGSDTLASRLGQDEGLTFRSRSPAGAIGFAAIAGTDEGRMAWALEQALGSCAAEPQGGVTWPVSRSERLDDRQQDLDLPSRQELADWLEHAWQGLAECVSPMQPLEAWVEASTIVESWCADPELRATRARTQVWALAKLRSKPMVIAARRLRDLPYLGWAALSLDRSSGTARRASGFSREMPVLFTPECSARLVQALVRAVHSQQGNLGRSVGAAWQVVDDPSRAAAVASRTFDDACFPTARKVLADGRQISGILEGRGHLRRPSFRDRPESWPTSLLVLAPSVELPAQCLRVSSLSLHPLQDDSWVLEVSGPAIERAFLRVSPQALLERCVAAHGPARESHLGVLTPALLFEGVKS